MNNTMNTGRVTSTRQNRRELAWSLRHERGWTLSRIGLHLGIKRAAVSRLLQRVEWDRSAPVVVAEDPMESPARRVNLLPLGSVYHV